MLYESAETEILRNNFAAHCIQLCVENGLKIDTATCSSSKTSWSF